VEICILNAPIENIEAGSARMPADDRPGHPKEVSCIGISDSSWMNFADCADMRDLNSGVGIQNEFRCAEVSSV